MVIRRFIAVFYPDCEFASTTIMAKVDLSSTGQKEIKFKATGKVITDQGWRVVFPSKEADEEDEKGEKENILPEYKVGEHGPHKPEIIQKQTQPPKYMTEGDLLKAMETAGKTVENEELRDLMKANGIGRPSTRAVIIETLLKRRYVYKDKKRILPTPIGVKLIETIPNQLLKSAELTGQWEKKLREISDGNFSAAQFMNQLKAMVGDVVQEVRMTPRKVLDEGQTSETEKPA